MLKVHTYIYICYSGGGTGAPPSGGAGGGGGGGFGRNAQRFDKGPQIDTWTNETAENADKEPAGNLLYNFTLSCQ